MKRFNTILPKPKMRVTGVTLVMVAAVLAVLAALATGFYTMTLSQSHSAILYADSVRAEMLARGGIQYGIAKLREATFQQIESPGDQWYTVDYLNGAQKSISFPPEDPNSVTVPKAKLPYTVAAGNTASPSGDRFTLNITDASSKININACDNLAVVLDNLCRVIGPPLIAADLDAIMPRRWGMEMFGNDPMQPNFLNTQNTNDLAANPDLYYQLLDESGAPSVTGRPARKADGTALYGDGYAIAGYRAAHGRYMTIHQVKDALTYVERSAPPNGIPDAPLERLEIEVKFQAIREFLTVDSWVDTQTVCVGKFEWVNTASGASVAIDRDKSWIPPGPNDVTAFRKNPNTFRNERGSLLGSFVSIINGHGSGQLRMITDNGVDWIRVEPNFAVDPGPISSYMIIAREKAPFVDIAGKPVNSLPPLLGTNDRVFPQVDATGNLVDNPNIDYSRFPLCIHRAPVNINTASDKVIEALLLGINISTGHPQSVGTDTDLSILRSTTFASTTAWKVIPDPKGQEEYLLTPKGLKRSPASTGKPILDCPVPWNSPADDAKFGYINNFSSLGSDRFLISGAMTCNEVHELAYRIIVARSRTQKLGVPDPDPNTADQGDGPAPYNVAFSGFERGPFTGWDDLYFRAIKPWDDIRSGYFLGGKATIPNSGNPGKAAGLGKASVARLIMANFNSNTDILKFNPNIEWIDRWGRNFRELEAVMAYSDTTGNNPPVADPITENSQPIFTSESTPAFGGRPPNTLNTYITRSYRYRSDDLIDKTDLNRSTTELAFDSKGIFLIQSTGQVLNQTSVLAEGKFEALVKVYDVWRESTQRQFVQGVIQTGPGVGSIGAPGTTHSGQVARDSVNSGNKRLPLITLPEPLVPLDYRIVNNSVVGNVEAVERNGKICDQYGNPKADPTVPDVLANKILPANYDGQIVLATNTSKFDPYVNDGKDHDYDTFLVSFNGDLDTDTCLGNGREQAKMPHTPSGNGDSFRVVDTCGLLGILNDTLIDIDTDFSSVPSLKNGAVDFDGRVFKWGSLRDAIKALNPNNYWENVSLRMGDLRTEGVYLSGPGVCGNDATLKYVFGDGKTAINDAWTDSKNPSGAKLNFDPGSPDGNLVTMWMKPAWHHSDHRTHPLFDATNPGWQKETACRACFIKKYGLKVWHDGGPNDRCTLSLPWYRTDDLNFSLEGNIGLAQDDGQRDKDFTSFLHGGFNFIDPANIANGECPSYRAQPFRWSFVGARWRFNADINCWGWNGHTVHDQVAGMPGGPGGNWWNENRGFQMYLGHAFIDTQTHPEFPGVGENLLWSYWGSLPNAGIHGFTYPCDIGDTGYVNGTAAGDNNAGFGCTGQPAKWRWADPYNTENPLVKIFGVNNLNQDWRTWIYHHIPGEGTYAVIDELKISSRERTLKSSKNAFCQGGQNAPYPNTPDFVNDRGVIEQTLSRYYLPPNPDVRLNCPTFTSQTLFQSIKGYSAVAAAAERITLARVTWTCFTPRFLHENIAPVASRTEKIQRMADGAPPHPQTVETNAFRGPFDYDKYNAPVYSTFSNNNIFPYGVDRPTPINYPTPRVQGIEVELINLVTGNPIAGSYETNPGSGTYTDTTGTFFYPEGNNRFLTASGAPVADATLPADQLKYRVRFRFPADQLVDPGKGKVDADGKHWVDPTSEYLLDTPVFDDISVTYFLPPRILSYGAETE